MTDPHLVLWRISALVRRQFENKTNKALLPLHRCPAHRFLPSLTTLTYCMASATPQMRMRDDSAVL